MGVTLLLLATGVTGYAIRKSHKRKVKKRDTFSISGPDHLSPIDWNNSNDRTSVTSCLVNGVYIMQKDKTENRKPLANPWWESFGFSLVETLINEADSSIYGAVFKYDKYDSYQNTPHLGIPPRYVIAFRGTSFSSETWQSDVQQDLRCFFNNLNKGKRFQHAIQAIETVVAKHSSETTSVWLAGHSLGAGIALLAGKTMARKGFPLNTYAFNPPNSSLPLEGFCPSDDVKELFRVAKSYIKVTVASLFDFQIKEDDPRIAAWTPYLYVHPKDIICSEYIGDFKHKNIMSKLGASKIERLVAKITLANLFSREGSAEPIQFLSSVHMTVNKNKAILFNKTHALKQWWEGDPARRENWESHEFRPSITDVCSG